MSITVNGLTKKFGDKYIFKDFSCRIPDLGVVILSGPSGVGKTTLLRMLSGLDKKYSGEILGVEIGDISYVFQEHRLFPALTALENTALAFQDEKSAEAIEKSAKMLTSLGLSIDEHCLYPHELSGGMRQRVSLARGFLKKSSLLLLDEPFKELDAGLIETVFNIIEGLSRHKAIVLVTHEELDKRFTIQHNIRL